MNKLQEALAYLRDVPAEHWSMDDYIRCGSIGCALGNLAMREDSKFGRIVPSRYHFEQCIEYDDHTYAPPHFAVLGSHMFDLPLSIAHTLFGPLTDEDVANYPEGSDKEIFFDRVKKLGLDDPTI